MAGDDETITIRVNAAQGEAALKSLGAAGIQASKDVAKIGDSGKSITDKYAALGAKVLGATKAIAAFGDAVKAVAVATDNYSGATKDAVDQVGKLTGAVASFDLAGVAASIGQLAGLTTAWAQGLTEVNVELGNAVNLKAVEAFKEILAVQNELVNAHEREVDALETKTAALLREIAVQKEAGGVQKFVADSIKETLDRYEKAGEAIPESIALQAASLGILSKSQEEAQKSAEELEEAAVKASEERAKAEKKASEEIIAALEAETKALDEKLAKDQARLKDALDKGKKIDTSKDSDAAKQNITDLRDEIKRLENQPLLDPDEVNRLNDLKDKAGAAADAMRDLGGVFTVTADDFLTEGEAADAAGAAWDVYRDLLDKAANRQKDANRELDQTEESLSDLADTTGEAADAYGDLANSADDLGEKGKKGGDKAKEGLEGLIEQQETAKANYETLISLASQLKQINADISLE